MKKKLFLIAIMIVLLTLVFVEPICCYAKSNYDYSKKGDMGITLLTTDQILESVLDTTLPKVEKDFLKNQELTLSYSASISSSNIFTEFDNGTLYVSAKPVTYVAQNGDTVVWAPLSVNGIEFVDNGYEKQCVLQNIGDDFNDFISVDYSAEFVLASSDINEYLNLAFDTATNTKQKIASENERYQRELIEYESNCILYAQYLAQLEQYAIDFDEYQSYLLAYNTWKSKKDAYDTYCNDLAAYNKEYSEYQKYLKQLEAYNKKYQLYREYLVALEKYQQDLENYNNLSSQPEIQTALYQLSVMKYINKPVTELSRTLSSAILGDAVTAVLAERKALIEVGKVEKRAVDLASEATEQLRPLIRQYLQCKTDTEKYAFYKYYRDDFSLYFNNLLCALDFIYQYPDYSLVRRYIAQRERTEQFEILLAQLYCICRAFTDQPIPNYIMRFKGKSAAGAGYFDNSYTIGDSKKRTPYQILGEDGYLEDLPYVVPLENGFPTIPKEPVEPKVVDEPTKPAVVSEPIEPKVVLQPGEPPAIVLQPTEPQEVQEPLQPTKYQPTEQEIILIEALDTNVLQQRPLFVDDVHFKVQTTIEKYFRNAHLITIRFFDTDGETINLVLDDVEYGASVEYNLDIPTQNVVGYNSTFDGWVDDDGNFFDLNKVITDKGDLSLYPHFDLQPIPYKITWEIDGKNIQAFYPYASIPKYDEDALGKLEKIRVGAREYRFVGWQCDDVFYSKENDLEVIFEEKTYSAVFEQSYVITWVVDGLSVGVAAWQGDMPVFDGIPQKKNDSKFTYSFCGWSEELSSVTCDKVYTAEFESKGFMFTGLGVAVVSFDDDCYRANCLSVMGKDFDVTELFKLASTNHAAIQVDVAGCTLKFPVTLVGTLFEKGISHLFIDAVMTNINSYRYCVRAYDENGIEIIVDDDLLDTTAKGVYDKVNSYLFSMNADGEKTESRFKYDGDTLVFRQELGQTYTFCPYFVIQTVSSNNVDILVDNKSIPGERVKLTLGDLPEGMYLQSVYVVDSEGTEIEVDDDLYFTMPSTAIMVGVVCDYKTYTIKFISEGKVMSTATYKYGSKVTAPKLPDKLPDDEYSYKFVGWDREIDIVTQDAEYHAVYEKTEREYVEEPHIESRLSKLITALYIVVPIGIVLVVGVIVFLIVLQLRKRKKLNSK